jgi:hypothetical protein
MQSHGMLVLDTVVLEVREFDEVHENCIFVFIILLSEQIVLRKKYRQPVLDSGQNTSFMDDSVSSLMIIFIVKYLLYG